MVLQPHLLERVLYRLCVIFFYAFASIYLCLRAQELPTRFSLEESVSYALLHNPQLKNAALSKENAYIETRKIIAIGLPKIEGSASYDYNFSVRSTILPDFLSPLTYSILEDEGLVEKEPRTFGVFPAQFGTTHSAAAGLELNQLLIDASYFVGLKAIKMLRQKADKELMQSEVELVDLIHRAYYLVLVSKKRTQLIEQNLRRMQTLLKETTVRYENGFVEKLEVDRLQVSLNLLQVEEQQAEAQLALNQRLLNIQMGLPVSHPTTLSDTLQQYDFSLDLEKKEDIPVSSRIEYQRLQLREQLGKMEIKNEKAKYFPSLRFVATAGYNTGNNQFNELIKQEWFPYSALGLRLKVPIFDGTQKILAVQEKKRNLLRVQNTRLQLERNLRQEQLQADTDLEGKLSSLQAQAANLQLASEVYNTSREKYAQGIGTNLEVLTSATTLKEVETQYYYALYEALVAKVALKKAQGTLHTKL